MRSGGSSGKQRSGGGAPTPATRRRRSEWGLQWSRARGERSTPRPGACAMSTSFTPSGSDRHIEGDVGWAPPPRDGQGIGRASSPQAREWGHGGLLLPTAAMEASSSGPNPTAGRGHGRDPEAGRGHGRRGASTRAGALLRQGAAAPSDLRPLLPAARRPELVALSRRCCALEAASGGAAVSWEIWREKLPRAKPAEELGETFARGGIGERGERGRAGSAGAVAWGRREVQRGARRL